VLRSRWGYSASALLLVVAGAGFTVQLVAGGPVLGPIGLLLLGVPGFVISQSVRPLPLSWPAIALVTLGSTVILTILVGIVSALSPHGLDATSAAATELVALALTSAAYVARSTRRGPTRAAIRIQAARGSIAAAAAGLVLAGVGFLVATQAALTQQQQASFVQFWTVASTTGGEPLLGLRNATGTNLDCSVAVSRPNRQVVNLAVGAVDDGQSWSGLLPPRDPSDVSRWQIALQCLGDDGSDVRRRLFVDPAAS
jgi:hypothetical protein